MMTSTTITTATAGTIIMTTTAAPVRGATATTITTDRPGQRMNRISPKFGISGGTPGNAR